MGVGDHHHVIFYLRLLSKKNHASFIYSPITDHCKDLETVKRGTKPLASWQQNPHAIEGRALPPALQKGETREWANEQVILFASTVPPPNRPGQPPPRCVTSYHASHEPQAAIIAPI
jgi:hypothetical protein